MTNLRFWTHQSFTIRVTVNHRNDQKRRANFFKVIFSKLELTAFPMVKIGFDYQIRSMRVCYTENYINYS